MPSRAVLNTVISLDFCKAPARTHRHVLHLLTPPKIHSYHPVTVNYCKLKGCLHQNICSTSIFFHLDDILVEDLQCVFDNIIFMNFSTNSTNTTRYYIRRSWSSTKLKKYEPFNWWPIAAAGISYGVWLLIIVFVGPDRINNACNYIENNYCVPTLTYLTSFRMRRVSCGRASRRGGRRRRSNSTSSRERNTTNNYCCIQKKKYSMKVAIIPTFKMKTRGVICTICQEEIKLNAKCRKMPACKHIFHMECIGKWKKESNQCPNCRCKI